MALKPKTTTAATEPVEPVVTPTLMARLLAQQAATAGAPQAAPVVVPQPAPNPAVVQALAQAVASQTPAPQPTPAPPTPAPTPIAAPAPRLAAIRPDVVQTSEPEMQTAPSTGGGVSTKFVEAQQARRAAAMPAAPSGPLPVTGLPPLPPVPTTPPPPTVAPPLPPQAMPQGLGSLQLPSQLMGASPMGMGNQMGGPVTLPPPAEGFGNMQGFGIPPWLSLLLSNPQFGSRQGPQTGAPQGGAFGRFNPSNMQFNGMMGGFNRPGSMEGGGNTMPSFGGSPSLMMGSRLSDPQALDMRRMLISQLFGEAAP